MGKPSNSGSQNTTSTVTNQTQIPQQLLPYVQSDLTQGQAIANQPYQVYPGQQIANQSADTLASYQQAEGLGSVGQGAVGQAGTALNAGLTTAQGLSGATPYQVSNPSTVASGNWTTPGTAQSYMSPYEQTALNAQLQIANQQFGQQQNERNSQAVQAGAYGGDRAALVNQQALSNFNNQEAATVASGLNTAYTTGQQAYQADNSANLLAQEANQQATLGTNQLNSSNYNAALQTQLGAAGLTNTIGNSLGSLGTTQQQLASNGLNALYSAGQSQQDYQQTGLNQAQTNFQNQINYPKNQVTWLSQLVNGTATPSSTDTKSIATNPITQLAGAGLGLSGLSSILSSSSGG